MGAGKLIDTNNPDVGKYVLRIGEIITLLSNLDYNVEIFIEAIVNLDDSYQAKTSIISLIRRSSFSKRLEFLNDLLKEKHSEKYEIFQILYREIKECIEIRNTLAHSQVFFHNTKDNSIMMISNLKKIEVKSPRNFFDPISIEILDSYIKKFREVTKSFHSYTYSLGYFQGHSV
ncbi:MAG: hypothetical protein WC489_00610 [Patescibacteria group bacterium]